ncbi:MAG: hypothetical protein H6712_28870 [Myxococcales bacterium]|nr:hypothetical protein [Myxococcales bacterium]MCB9717896.1 hypothetical protein [Myxococcales bacterium]
MTRNVEVDVVDRPGIREFAKRSMYEHTTPEELARLGRVQASMGMIPRGSDAEQIVLDLLEDGVAGFYDPKEKTLFIGDFVDKVTLSMVVGHEIAHGLQDMHFDLQKHQEPLPHRNDEETARRFLIEGGAQATYLAWVSGASGLESIEDRVLDAMGNQVLDLADFASDYPILVRSLQLPYADGTATITRLVRQKGWKAVDELYDALPESSEQMLHIDKLLAREPPIPTKMDVGVLQALIPGTELLWHDTLGEAELLTMLSQSVRSTEARRAAAGWGGDHYVAIEKARPAGDSGSDRQQESGWSVPLVVGVIVWDTDRDAAEFEEVFADYLQRMVPDDHAIDRRGDRVLFATGIPPEVDASKLVATAWKGVHTNKPRRRRSRKEPE